MDVLLQEEGKKKYRIGVYLGVDPYCGGSFQYAQSILEALRVLFTEQYDIVAFYHNDLWQEYLSRFSFATKKVYLPRELFDWKGEILHRLVRLCGVNISKIRKLYATVSKFSQQFDNANLDLIIFPSQEMFSSLIKTKSIAVIHDLMHRYEKFPEVAASTEFKNREYSYNAICNAASIIFADSEVGKKHVIESYGEQYKSKIVVMPFAPPQYLFEDNTDVIPDDIKLPEKFIFYPAQFWKHKNHKKLVLAVSYLKQKGIDVHLVFVGSKKNGYQEIMEVIESQKLQNNVYVLGYVSDLLMKLIYKKARAMIMPTYFGPTNIPPLEGMAMGCPVAVSNVYAMPWQVGDAGLTFDPNSIDEIASTIEKLWTDDDLCKQMAVKGEERAKYFSQENFNKRFKDAIMKVLE